MNEEKRYIFKTVFMIETSIGSYYDLELMKHINEGWNVFYFKKGLIVFRKEASEEEYNDYYQATDKRVTNMNNCPYLD